MYIIIIYKNTFEGERGKHFDGETSEFCSEEERVCSGLTLFK